MSQPEISPLARRLAEENNVDWRDLHGSGAGGKVVERDVLEYLARVMAGEEDIDPTPEPVPEGMESWPEEDIQAFQQEVSASHQNVGLQQIQQELSASDRLSHGPSEPSLEGGPVPPVDEVPPASTHAQPEPDTISEDIFLFDDEEEAAEVPGGDEAAWQASPTPPSEEVEDGLLVAGDESTAWDAGDDELGDGEELWAGAASHEEPDTLPDVFGGGDEGERSGRDSGPALFDDGAGARRDDAAPASDGAGDLEVPPLGDLAGHEGAPASSVDASGPRWPAEADGLEAEDASFGTGGWQVEQPGAQPDELAEGFEPPRESAADAAGEAYAAAQEESFEAPDEPYGGAGADVGGWEGASEPQPAAFDGASAESAFVESDEGVPAPEPGSVEPPAAPPALSERVAGGMDAASAVPSELPLVTYGTLLRRHLDVTALAGAQLAVGLELGESEPLSPAPFLLRAAAKAVADGGWAAGRVAMVGWDEGGTLRVGEVESAAARPFMELVRELSAVGIDGAADASGMALAVADMSALDVDEAILNVQVPLLTLGRILYDNQRGSYRSTLSLAGDVPPDRGAKLLARVAELLDAPVRLLL